MDRYDWSDWRVDGVIEGGGRDGKETKSDNERRKARRGKCVQGHGNEYLQIQCKVLADALKVYVKQKKKIESMLKRGE